MDTTTDPRRLLQAYDLKPRRSLGQNFLVDPAAPGRIVSGAEVSSQDVVLEVGAGVGTLTAALAERAGQVLAVETDPQLVTVLQEELGERDNVRIIHGDILALDPAALLDLPSPSRVPLWGPLLEHYLVVANLPYYITAAVIRHLFEASVRPQRAIFTVQYEVAQRMAAQPDEMSLLAVSVQFYGVPRILFRLKRGAFYPAPAVDSAVVRIDLHSTPPVETEDVEGFFRIVRAGFAQRRKQLKNTLGAGMQLDPNAVAGALSAAGIDPSRRAETLSLGEWGRVMRALAPLMNSPA